MHELLFPELEHEEMETRDIETDSTVLPHSKSILKLCPLPDSQPVRLSPY
jgi:hypothetical protein